MLRRTASRCLLFIGSWAVVAYGQPSRSIACSLIAAVCGYAALWLVVLSVKSSRRRMAVSSLLFTAVSMVHLSWFTSSEYHGPYILIVYAALSLWLGLQFALLSLSLPLSHPFSISRALFIASLWTLIEWGRLYIFCGFAWNPVGLALGASTLSAQWAAIGGVLGLSFWVMLVNGVALVRRPALWSLLALTPFAYGAITTSLPRRDGASYRVALVQTGLHPEEKVPLIGRTGAFIHPALQWQRILQIVERAASQPLDLIVLPEAALPFGAHMAIYQTEQMRLLFPDAKGPLTTNAECSQAVADMYNADVIVGLDGRETNSAFHYRPFHSYEGRYDKRVLVPLAEYLPIEALRPIVATYGIANFFTHGNEGTIFPSKVRLAPSICYEECFSHIVRESYRAGADLLVNITNDYWYPDSMLPSQHFEHGRLRGHSEH